MGANTADVIKRGDMPVLAVPARSVFKPPKHIIITDDGDPVAPAALRVLLDMTQRTGATVIVLRMINEDEQLGSADPPACSFEAVPGAVPHTHVYVSGEDLVGVLDDQIRRSDAEMFTVVHRERGWLEGLFHRSMAARLEMHTHVPMLVLQKPIV